MANRCVSSQGLLNQTLPMESFAKGSERRDLSNQKQYFDFASRFISHVATPE
jgi:hypothetical protein